MRFIALGSLFLTVAFRFASGYSEPSTSVSARGGHTCGVRTDGSIACWSAQVRGLTAPAGG